MCEWGKWIVDGVQTLSLARLLVNSIYHRGFFRNSISVLISQLVQLGIMTKLTKFVIGSVYFQYLLQPLQRPVSGNGGWKKVIPTLMCETTMIMRGHNTLSASPQHKPRLLLVPPYINLILTKTAKNGWIWKWSGLCIRKDWDFILEKKDLIDYKPRVEDVAWRLRCVARRKLCKSPARSRWN